MFFITDKSKFKISVFFSWQTGKESHKGCLNSIFHNFIITEPSNFMKCMYILVHYIRVYVTSLFQSPLPFTSNCQKGLCTVAIIYLTPLCLANSYTVTWSCLTPIFCQNPLMINSAKFVISSARKCHHFVRKSLKFERRFEFIWILF